MKIKSNPKLVELVQDVYHLMKKNYLINVSVVEKKLNIWLFGESHISDFLFLAKIRQKKTLEYQELIN